LTMKNTNNEQSRRDAPQKPYHLPPGAGSQWTGFRRSAFPNGRARSRRDGKELESNTIKWTSQKRDRGETLASHLLYLLVALCASRCHCFAGFSKRWSCCWYMAKARPTSLVVGEDGEDHDWLLCLSLLWFSVWWWSLSSCSAGPSSLGPPSVSTDADAQWLQIWLEKWQIIDAFDGSVADSLMSVKKFVDLQYIISGLWIV
jgi:hypothetical protein